MSRKINDGDLTGMKQDKFRNSRFEYNPHKNPYAHDGVREKTNNTLMRRLISNADPKKTGYIYFQNVVKRGVKKHGGSLVSHEIGHYGKGPRGYTRGDELIYHDVCERLTISSLVDASQIEVSVKNGIVYLNGSVSHRSMKKMAEFEIENISGVHDVHNNLRLLQRKKDFH
jgi:hypothetical protein